MTWLRHTRQFDPVAARQSLAKRSLLNLTALSQQAKARGVYCINGGLVFMYVSENSGEFRGRALSARTVAPVYTLRSLEIPSVDVDNLGYRLAAIK
jgi:hypothetical protein